MCSRLRIIAGSMERLPIAPPVFGIFRTLGYRVSVAHVLTGLTTNTIPRRVWQAVPRSAGARR